MKAMYRRGGVETFERVLKLQAELTIVSLKTHYAGEETSESIRKLMKPPEFSFDDNQRIEREKSGNQRV